MFKSKTLKTALAALAVSLSFFSSADAQSYLDVTKPMFEDYFTISTSAPAKPDGKGFIRRWSLLEPIPRPDLRSNNMFTDTWLRNEFAKEVFPGQMTVIPKDGDKVKLDKKTTLKWHCVDSKLFNVKLYRFATGLGLHATEGLYQAVTVIEAPREMKVRLAVGSNSGSQWWLNGEDVLLLSNDRRMVVDDVVSKVITLKEGKNVLRGQIINGPGMSDFCVRFLDEKGNPVRNIKITNE